MMLAARNLSEKPVPAFRNALFATRILPENRFPLFGMR